MVNILNKDDDNNNNNNINNNNNNDNIVIRHVSFCFRFWNIIKTRLSIAGYQRDASCVCNSYYHDASFGSFIGKNNHRF